MDLIYQREWSENGISVNAYVHQLRNYRYNWHENEYELNIVLTGSAEFVRGNDYFTLERGDIILINPNVGHASYSLMDKTATLVIHMPAEIFQPLLESGQSYHFMYVTDYKSRNTLTAIKLRYYAVSLFLSLTKSDKLNVFQSRALIDLIAALLVEEVPRTIIPYHKEDELHRQAIRIMTKYMQEHFAEKITLDDLASLTQYNRTYISTLFKETLGIRFYDYLIRLRISNALYSLKDETLTLTDVALDNGFPDLKNFNSRFREFMHISPSQYRAVIRSDPHGFLINQRHFYHPGDPLIAPVLKSYLDIFAKGKDVL
jgi:AraC-like DNA-binding protein